MNLEQYENKLAGSLSGGNKRKLLVAMTMIGNSPVVFLDEPSAVMDPKTRRFMLEVIAKISTRGKNSAVILTTHSMEEAEALSTNMGIMVKGQFQCFGLKQHIKNKFDTGYQVEIKFKTVSNDELKVLINSLEIIEFLRKKYPSCYKIDKCNGIERIYINKKAGLAILRDLIKNAKIIKEFSAEGFGKEIIEELEENSYYPSSELLNWQYIIKNNMTALGALTDQFGEALLLEQYTPRYRYRVSKETSLLDSSSVLWRH